MIPVEIVDKRYKRNLVSGEMLRRLMTRVRQMQAKNPNTKSRDLASGRK
jgi:hypothetical protein